MNGGNVLRKLDPALKEWFDAALLNPTPMPFVEPRNPVQMFLLTAFACKGITEVGADNFGPMVERFQKTIGDAKGEPWCLSFIQSCVAYVESFGFKSDLFPTEHCLTAWTNSRLRRPLVPEPGDVVLYHLEGTTKGHAEIVTAWLPKLYSIETIAGNTSAANGMIEREGDGVYTKSRSPEHLGNMKRLGYLRIFD